MPVASAEVSAATERPLNFSLLASILKSASAFEARLADGIGRPLGADLMALDDTDAIGAGTGATGAAGVYRKRVNISKAVKISCTALINKTTPKISNVGSFKIQYITGVKTVILFSCIKTLPDWKIMKISHKINSQNKIERTTSRKN